MRTGATFHNGVGLVAALAGGALLGCAARSPAPARPEQNSKPAGLPILPGVGNTKITLRDTPAKIRQLYGKPERVRGFKNVQIVDYRQRHAIDFLVDKRDKHILEIRFNRGYRGSLANGIGLGSTLDEVLEKSGGDRKTVTTTRKNFLAHGSNRVLYRVTFKGKVGAYLFRDTKRGILYWFNASKQCHQIVVYRSNKHARIGRGEPITLSDRGVHDVWIGKPFPGLLRRPTAPMAKWYWQRLYADAQTIEGFWLGRLKLYAVIKQGPFFKWFEKRAAAGGVPAKPPKAKLAQAAAALLRKGATVHSIVITGNRVKTAQGIGVGATLAAVLKAHPGAKVRPSPPAFGDDRCAVTLPPLKRVYAYFETCAKARAGSKVTRIVIFGASP